MKQIQKATLLILGTFIFHILFWEETIGLNLFIFNIGILALLGIQGTLTRSKSAIILSIATIGLSILILYHNSGMSKFTYIFTLLTLIGYHHSNQLRSLPFALFESFLNYVRWPVQFGHSISSNDSGSIKLKRSNYARKVRVVFIPLIITAIFIWIFKMSNPVFEGYVDGLTEYLSDFFNRFFRDFSWLRMIFFLWGFSIIGWILYITKESFILKKESKKKLTVVRERKQKKPVISNLIELNTVSLTNENYMGRILLVLVNLLLVIINAIDIKWIWIDFDYTTVPHFTKFVHEGTYLLILSVALSMFILLYLFRKNQNFYPKKNTLHLLAYIWIVQNGILLISVCLSNYYYIQQFGLAYKRIGVMFFLFATLSGLGAMAYKIQYKKTGFFLMKKNSWVVFACFMTMSFFNWDDIILNYNLKKGKDITFLYYSSDKLLPQLFEIENAQGSDLQDSYNYGHAPGLLYRIKSFQNRMENTSIMSWNFADYKTYKYFERYENQKN